MPQDERYVPGCRAMAAPKNRNPMQSGVARKKTMKAEAGHQEGARTEGPSPSTVQRGGGGGCQPAFVKNQRLWEQPIKK